MNHTYAFTRLSVVYIHAGHTDTCVVFVLPSRKPFFAATFVTPSIEQLVVYASLFTCEL